MKIYKNTVKGSKQKPVDLFPYKQKLQINVETMNTGSYYLYLSIKNYDIETMVHTSHVFIVFKTEKIDNFHI